MSDTSEFELALRIINPSMIIIYEPLLEVMRCIEIYNAERVFKGSQDDLEVSLLMYEESTEYYQYMSIVSAEKIGFDKLINSKERLHIELKDY